VTTPRSRLRRALDTLLGVLLLPVILFEEWGWEALLALAARVASWLHLQALQRRIAALPPYGALAALLLPSLLLLPVKLLGLWLLTRGLVLWSLVLVVLSKIAGTAVLAQLFTLTRPQLMRIGWFARGYARWTAWKDRWLAWVRATAPWQAARRWRRLALRWWRRGRAS
jgi:hypothetical protein